MSQSQCVWQIQDQNSSKSIKAKMVLASCTVSTRDLTRYEGSFNCDVIVGDDLLPRRLTPLECERLQGFPDGYTDIPHKGQKSSDSSRYKAIGNSMAVSCMAWLGERIAQEDARQ